MNTRYATERRTSSQFIHCLTDFRHDNRKVQNGGVVVSTELHVVLRIQAGRFGEELGILKRHNLVLA